MSLTTGRVLTRTHWTKLPMPQDVITRVNDMGRQQRNPGGLEFLNRAQMPFNNDDEDDEADPAFADGNADPIDAFDDHPAFADGEVDPLGTDVPENADVQPDEIADNIEGVYDDEEIPFGHDNNEGVYGDEEIPPPHTNYGDEEIPPTHDNEDSVAEADPLHAPEPAEQTTDAPPATNMDTIFDQRYGPRTSGHNLRPRRERNYGHLHATFAESNGVDNDAEDEVLGFAMQQVSMKKGIKLFGEKGTAAVETELQQLHDRKVMEPVDGKKLSWEEKRKALPYLMFLKDKRDGKVKARGCADGRKQRVYTAKEEASSPTVSIESILLTCVIDAEEERDVATADIPGAFMQADMDEVVYMRLEGTMVDLLLKIDPDRYGPWVFYENGKKVLYVLLLKALYGTVRAAL
ncbi:MAG: reverse transcriptase domain-containing protein, partial [Plesiomonas shigelloides]